MLNKTQLDVCPHCGEPSDYGVVPAGYTCGSARNGFRSAKCRIAELEAENGEWLYALQQRRAAITPEQEREAELLLDSLVTGNAYIHMPKDVLSKFIAELEAENAKLRAELLAMNTRG